MADEKTDEKVPQWVGERGLDEMFQDEMDSEAATQTLADALLEAGWYRTKPALSVSGSEPVAEGFDAQGQPTAAKRRVFRFFGEVSSRPPRDSHDGFQAKHGRVGFGLSPDRRNRPAESGGGPDTASLLWAQAVNAFHAVYGQKPTNNGEVVRFVKDYAVDVRVIQIGIPTENRPEPRGEPRNMVVALAPVRE